MLTEYSFESNLLKAVAAAKLVEVAATQLAEQSADAVATGAVWQLIQGLLQQRLSPTHYFI